MTTTCAPNSGNYFYTSSGGYNGAIMQLACTGIMTAILTGNPLISFWKNKAVPYTNFAMQSMVQSFASGVAFGETAQTTVGKAGDLIYFMYAVIQLPGIRACPARGSCGPSQNFPYSLDPSNPCGVYDAEYFATVDGGASTWLFDNYGSCGDYEDSCAANACGAGGGGCDGDPWVYWANAVGQLLVKTATLTVGAQVVDVLYNDYLYMWEELAGKPGKRLTEMVGKRYCREDLIADSQQTRTLYVPLPFYFTLNSGLAFPIVACTFTNVTITIQVECLRNCVVVSGPDIEVVKCNGGGILTSQDLRLALDVTHVFLQNEERDRFATYNIEYIITQVAALYQCVSCTNVRIPLAFTGQIIELIWAVRRRCAEKYNNWFNYSGILGREPIVAAELLFNNTARQSKREASYYRLVQPYQFHTCIPEGCIYNYSFSLYPEDVYQPSGSVAANRLESMTLVLDLQDGLQTEDVTVIVFARQYNLLVFKDGVAGVRFS